MKRCPVCNTTKPLSEFYSDKARADGRMSRCKDCDKAKRSRHYADNREDVLAKMRAWRAANPEEARRRSREDWTRRSARMTPEQRLERNRAKLRDGTRRHGGPEERARLWALQDGCCYLCGRPFELGQPVHVDHDHSCCPGGKSTDSCQACRRGLTHPWCNQIIGLAGEDMDVLRAIIASFEPVQAAARARILAAGQQLAGLF